MVNHNTYKRRLRRIRAKVSNKSETFTILHSNIRGYSSKSISLQAIAGCKMPTVLTLNETMLLSNKELNLKGRYCFTSNRTGTGGGGIATCIRKNDKGDTIKMYEGEDDLELLVTRHGQYSTPINILNIYGAVESRSTKDKIKERWIKIREIIKQIEAKRELLVVIVDLNAHVGDIIPGNKAKISYGGQFLREFLESEQYTLVNATDKTVGGPFTRIDPSNEESKSALDLVVVSNGLLKYVDSVVIDKERLFTTARPVSKCKVNYTDHYSLLLTLSLPSGKTKRLKNQTTMWNTNREGGWELYENLTTENRVLEDAAKSTANANEIMEIIHKELDNAKYSAFGKVKVKDNCQYDKELAEIQMRKAAAISNGQVDIENVEKEIASTLLVKQRDSFKKN